MRDLAVVADIPLEVLQGGEYLDLDLAPRLWDAAARLAGDSYVGLRAGLAARVEQMGPVGPAIVQAATVRDSLAVVSRLIPLLINGSEVELREAASTVTVAYRIAGRRSRHGPDSILGAIAALIRQGAVTDVVPDAVTFECDPPRHVAPYVDGFGLRPDWGQPWNAITYRGPMLSVAMKWAAPATSELLLDHARTLIQGHRPLRELSLALHTAVERCGYHRATVATVAAHLGVPTRTLQRRLARDGASFTSVRDAVSMKRARELIRRAIPVVQIAEQLGFAHRTGFERAFTRHEGCSPAVWRRRMH